jgi:hypothetical protein
MIPLGFDGEPYPVGTHMCLIFNDEFERRWVMSKYIQSGLGANEQVSYFVDTMPPEDLKKWMRELGVTLPDELDGRQYSFLEADQTYCPDGTFKVEPIIETPGLPVPLDVDRLDLPPAVQPATPSRTTAHPEASPWTREPRNGKQRTSLSSSGKACPYLRKEPGASKPSDGQGATTRLLKERDGLSSR